MMLSHSGLGMQRAEPASGSRLGATCGQRSAGPRVKHGLDYANDGPISAAKLVRARFSRDFTVPRLQEVISAISS